MNRELIQIIEGLETSDGAGVKLRPVLKFTKVDDASQLAQVTQDAVVTVISCIEK